MIKPWVFEFVPEKTDASGASADPDYFHAYIDLWTRDEALGFEGVFFSEHHYGGSFSSSPHLLLAATAMRTKTLRLGVMGVVTTYYSPVRLLEEIGLLDHLTRGRLEVGLSVGVPQELSRLNISMEEARAINEEVLDILQRALPAGRLDHQGLHFAYKDVPILPPVHQRPHPEIWTTIVSEDSARKAAQRGLKISTGFNAREKIKSIFDAYREEAQRAGFPSGPDNLALRRRVVIAPSRSEALELSAQMTERYKTFTAADARMKMAAVPDDNHAKGGFSLSADEFIACTPQEAAENIIEQCRHVGAQHFLAVLHWGADFEEVRNAHELFGAQVIPLLRKAAL
ncbi:MAG: LLM class flavin-dependent oxidoreductase [Alphaproteobacteria bacterium]|nr:LLM class flavin-dependent oxidoreductase [Alphaproteobacteria bacterium]